MRLEKLMEFDDLKEVVYEKCPAFVHNEHRFALPLIHHYQKKGKIPKPVVLIMFDHHNDCVVPPPIEKIIELKKAELSLEKLIAFCKNNLRPFNDDWIKTGMELGFISDVVIFGGDKHGTDTDSPYIDHLENEHKIEISFLPGAALERQGGLGELVHEDQYRNLWNILGWEHIPRQRFEFDINKEKNFLSIDLDCFVGRIVVSKEYFLPWPDEIFKDQFYSRSGYYATKGWSGKAFFDGLVEKAGLLTIAREPQHCGGNEKSNIVLRNVNRFLFDGKLLI